MIPQYSMDGLPREPSLREHSATYPPNENMIQSNGEGSNRRKDPLNHRHSSDAHQATPGRQQFQGVFAPPSVVTKKPRVRAEASQRPTKSSPLVDYQLLLISLADEYFLVAHGRETLDAIARGETDLQFYYKLIATGLGCLEVLLNVGNLRIFNYGADHTGETDSF